jgi:hypothetical protein
MGMELAIIRIVANVRLEAIRDHLLTAGASVQLIREHFETRLVVKPLNEPYRFVVEGGSRGVDCQYAVCQPSFCDAHFVRYVEALGAHFGAELDVLEGAGPFQAGDPDLRLGAAQAIEQLRNWWRHDFGDWEGFLTPQEAIKMLVLKGQLK